MPKMKPKSGQMFDRTRNFDQLNISLEKKNVD